MAAEIKIHLRYNLETGKKDIIIEYDSEDDAMPYEHEQRHRQIVQQLIGQGLVDEEDVGNILVGRVENEKAPADQRREDAPVQQGQAAGAGE